MKNKISYEDLKIDLQKRENYETIEKAYLYAKEVHKGMKRLSGDDFMVHILESVKILLDLNVDDTTIIAAFLHEVMDSGGKTFQDVEVLFGHDVAIIVESVNKINKLELADESEASAIYLRKVLVGLARDVRVLYVKLACRLHNMRTNWAINPEHQKDKARDTLNVLVPIAHRLGINSIKSELENLSLYYLKPDVYNDILEKLNNTAQELTHYLEDMKASIIEILTDAGIKFQIKGRVKSVYSIYNKLSNGKKWDDIYDILALRVFVSTELECYQVVGLIHSRFRPIPKRFKDYIAIPKENMYQSLHTTVYGIDNKMFEIQIRTYEMDEIAEKGIASHWSYKEKGTKKIQNIMEQKLEMFRNVIETTNEADNSSLESVSEGILAEQIYVYTPKGDVIELPKGSTPIDFAYRIHSRIGDTMVSAIVNDAIVPLTHELNNNDIVSIKTNSSSTPNMDWLNIAKTPQARSKIKAYFSKKDKEEYTLKGKEILEKELRKRKLSFNEVLNSDAIKKITKDLKLKDMDEVYFAIGSLRFTAGYVINLASTDKNKLDDALFERNRNTPKINYKSDILVNGEANIMVNIAHCCMPIKGDEIIGFITKGQGISVHKKSCSNVKNSSDRLIEVAWNNEATNYYYTNIYVTVSSLKDLMATIITEIGKKDVLVRSCEAKTIDDKVIYEINIRVKNKEELETIENAILRLNNVVEVKSVL